MIELPDGSVSSVGSRTSMYAPQPWTTSGALSQNLPLFWGRAKGNLVCLHTLNLVLCGAEFEVLRACFLLCGADFGQRW